MKKTTIATATIILALTALTPAFGRGMTDTPPPDSTAGNAVMTTPLPAHQCYKGIEIDGTKEEFAKKLDLQEIFADIRTERQEHFYNGTFAGYKVKNTVITTPLTQTVYCIQTFLEKRRRFEEAYEDYRLFLTNLTAVYGQPETRKEEYNSPYTKGDGYTIRALGEGKATFLAAWNTGIGIILIKILPAADGFATLMISYTDNANETKDQQEKTEIIRRDL